MTCAQWMDLASLVSFFVWSSAALTVRGAPPSGPDCTTPPAMPCLSGAQEACPPRLGGPEALAEDELCYVSTVNGGTSAPEWVARALRSQCHRV